MFKFIRRFLILSVLFIFIKESYWPIQDKDREHYDRFVELTNYKSNIDREILILFKVTEERYPSFKQYFKNIKLNYAEKKKIVKFKVWLKHDSHKNTNRKNKSSL